MKKFGNLFIQDFTVTIRSGFHYALIGLAALFIILIHFVIPEQINTTPDEVFFDNTRGKVFENMLTQSGADAGLFYDNKDDFVQAVNENRGTIGIMVTGSRGEYAFDIITRGKIAEKTQNLIIAAMESITAVVSGESPVADIDYELLRVSSSPVPFNKDFIPVFITFEVIMMGFILIAVLVFQEKQEGSIRAYRISPSGTLQYILSKTAVLTIMGLLYGFFSIVFIVGFNADYVLLLLIVLLASVLMNLLGLGLAVFFKNISEFLIVSIATLALIQLPVISYFNPTFSPGYLRWIPSYPVMFGVREAVFSTGKENFLWPTISLLLIEIAAVFIFCYWAVRSKLMKSGGRI
jgi:hypothetical protein